MINLRVFSKKKILVAGGRGFIGTNLVGRLAKMHCRIVSVGRTKKDKATNAKNVTEIVGDLTLKSTWEKVLPADIVFHLAAQNDLDISERDPIGNWKDNVVPMLHLLEISKKRNFSPIVIFAGTDTEVGLTKRLPVDESFDDSPVTIYDLHKLFCEKYLELYSKSGIVKGVTLRFSNIYGPGPKSGPGRGILNSMILKAISGESLTVYGSGSWIRDYVYVSDAVDALLSAVVNIGKIKGRHFVIGTGKGYTVESALKIVALKVLAKTGKNVERVHIKPSRRLMPIEMRNMVTNSTLFSRLTGWRPRFDLETGIGETVDYFMQKK